MKKYIIVAVMVLGTTVYGFTTNQKTEDKCNCNQTEICTCATDTCECSSCGN